MVTEEHITHVRSIIDGLKEMHLQLHRFGYRLHAHFNPESQKALTALAGQTLHTLFIVEEKLREVLNEPENHPSLRATPTLPPNSFIKAGPIRTKREPEAAE